MHIDKKDIENLGFTCHDHYATGGTYFIQGERSFWLFHGKNPTKGINIFQLQEQFTDETVKVKMDWAEINDIGQLEWMLACFGVIEIDFLDDVREALKRVESNLKLIEPRGKAEEIHKDLDFLLKRLCEEQKDADFSIYEKITKQ